MIDFAGRSARTIRRWKRDPEFVAMVESLGLVALPPENSSEGSESGYRKNVAQRIVALTTFGTLALLTACSGKGFEGTVACRGDTAELRFDPSDGAEVHGAREKLGWADADGRGLDDEHCERVTTQTAWFTGITYEHTSQPMTLRCRLPGRFYLHAHPTFSSESGELFPDGSGLYLVIEKSRTIVASAGIGEDAAKSTVSFSPRYCTPA